MFGILKWLAGLAVVAIVGVGVGVYFAFFGAGPQVTYVTPDLVPIDLNTAAPSDQPPVNLPAAVSLPSASGTRATRRSPGADSLATPTFMGTT